MVSSVEVDVGESVWVGVGVGVGVVVVVAWGVAMTVNPERSVFASHTRLLSTVVVGVGQWIRRCNWVVW